MCGSLVGSDIKTARGYHLGNRFSVEGLKSYFSKIIIMSKLQSFHEIIWKYSLVLCHSVVHLKIILLCLFTYNDFCLITFIDCWLLFKWRGVCSLNSFGCTAAMRNETSGMYFQKKKILNFTQIFLFLYVIDSCFIKD